MSLQSSKKGKEEDPGNYTSVNITFSSGKMSWQIFLEATSKHTEDKKVIGSSQYRFTKGIVTPDKPGQPSTMELLAW